MRDRGDPKIDGASYAARPTDLAALNESSMGVLSQRETDSATKSESASVGQFSLLPSSIKCLLVQKHQRYHFYCSQADRLL